MTATWYWCHLGWDSFPNAGHSRESGNPTRRPFYTPADGLDSRFRGNDRDLQCLCLANDLGDRDTHVLTPEKLVYIIASRGFCKEVELPLYEYECTQCGQRTEKIRKFSDPPLTKCEKCGGKLKQLVSRSAIQFKGKGWYVTDYAAKPSPATANSAASSGDGSKEKSPEGAKKKVVPDRSQKSGVRSKKQGV